MDNCVDMSNFFHTILFAYQKSAKDILGTGEAVLIHPIFERILCVSYKQNKELIEAEPAKYLETFMENLLKEGIVKWLQITEDGDEKYTFHVEGCKFSKDIHHFLDTKDTTCPFALMVMAFLQVTMGKKIIPADSEYTKTGTKTPIKFLPNPKTEKKALNPIKH
jgi:hypothetical protein